MKRALICLFTLSALALAVSLAHPAPRSCEGNDAQGAPVKASSFAPRTKPPHKPAYGAPIQKPILSHRVKHKPSSAGSAPHPTTR